MGINFNSFFQWCSHTSSLISWCEDSVPGIFYRLTSGIPWGVIPLRWRSKTLKEKDFWYCYCIIARNGTEATHKAERGEYEKILSDTGANYTLTTPRYDQFLTDRTKSMLSTRGAFGNKVTPTFIRMMTTPKLELFVLDICSRVFGCMGKCMQNFHRIYAVARAHSGTSRSSAVQPLVDSY